MVDIVYAMGQGGGGGEGGAGGGLMSFLPFILIFVVFYFLLIRPQQKKAKDHTSMINTLRKGDQVLTSGGIYGKITSLDAHVVKLEIADRTTIKISRSSVGSLVTASGDTSDSKEISDKAKDKAKNEK